VLRAKLFCNTVIGDKKVHIGFIIDGNFSYHFSFHIIYTVPRILILVLKCNKKETAFAFIFSKITLK